MSKEYDHKKIEKKWQRAWKKSDLYTTKEQKGVKKSYVLDMFPYPSGDGLHVGHPKGYIATDVYSRMKRMQGFNILHPMGFDAFGLPAENFAIKNKIHPKQAVDKNIKYFKEQLSRIGFNYDWKREINTTDPGYYKWTQWIFLQMYKRGLAYQSHEPINWCPSCQTGLANEDLEDGKCERCGSVVEKRPLRQWVLKITDYADRLLKDIDSLNWPESIKESQRNWIGRSEGVQVKFPISNFQFSVEVFTTRIDTIFSGTFVILAPENPLISKLLSHINNQGEVASYVANSINKPEIERIDKENKSGVELKGIKAINPATNEEIPVWVSDFVLGGYGTGAVFADAHDKRDFDMAKAHGIPLKTSIRPHDSGLAAKVESLEICFEGDGILYNSGEFNGLHSKDARQKITAWLEEKNLAKKTIKYKLRDWVFSRQRYWGEPIPLIHCEHCKNVKQKVLIIHGFEGSGEGNWFPWMKKELEEKGFEVVVPTISTSKHPTVESWLKELTPLFKNFGPHDIVVGHSLGAKAALLLLSKTKKKIKHLFLVASAIGTARDWKAFEKLWDDPSSDLAALRKFTEVPIDYEKASSYADEVTFLVSNDDEIIKPLIPEALPLRWSKLTWHGHRHFNAKQIPELLDLILQSKNTGVVPVPEKDLPVKLPDVKHYEPSGTGESPLANITSWVNVKCPICKGKARRETNTMPQWAGSSWYYLRYMDPKNKKEPVNGAHEKYWAPVDLYVGGAEHATRHLIYARFWHKFLLDIGTVSTLEPFSRLQHVGLIIAEDGRKMSKRYGNVINPDDIVDTYGADTLRVYEMFMGPFDQSIAWNTKSLIGSRRFLDRVWRLSDKVSATSELPTESDSLLHQTIKKVGDDIEAMKFNTAISQLMILVNSLEKFAAIPATAMSAFARILAPFAPHIAEELWQKLGEQVSIHASTWPKFDDAKLTTDTITIVVQVAGKMRATLSVSRSEAEDVIKKQALNLPEIKRWTEGHEVTRVIFVPGRLVNIVVA